MEKDIFADPSKTDIVALAKEVTASDTTWAEFQKDPNAYAKKHGYKLTFTASQVDKIRQTTRPEAIYILSTTTDLNSTSGLW
jgi:hypothetical protein